MNTFLTRLCRGFRRGAVAGPCGHTVIARSNSWDVEAWARSAGGRCGFEPQGRNSRLLTSDSGSEYLAIAPDA